MRVIQSSLGGLRQAVIVLFSAICAAAVFLYWALMLCGFLGIIALVYFVLFWLIQLIF